MKRSKKTLEMQVITCNARVFFFLLALKLPLFPSHIPPLSSPSLSLQFDSDGDGQISLGELREAMKKLMGEQLNHREIDEILHDVDLNGDGQVDFEGKKGTWRRCDLEGRRVEEDVMWKNEGERNG